MTLSLSRRPPRSGRRWVDPSDPIEGPALAAGYHALLEALAPIAVPLDRLQAALRGTAAQWARTRFGAPPPLPTPSSAPPQEAPSPSRRRRRRGRPPAAPAAPYTVLPPPEATPLAGGDEPGDSDAVMERQPHRHAAAEAEAGTTAAACWILPAGLAVAWEEALCREGGPALWSGPDDGAAALESESAGCLWAEAPPIRVGGDGREAALDDDPPVGC
jgi:hypothetical protein